MAPQTSSVPVVTGVAVGRAGLGFVGAGLWARRDVARALALEHILSTPDAKSPSAPVTTAVAARSMAEVIRHRTLEATGGRTHAETETFVDADGNPTSDEALALKDERAG